MFNQVTIGMLFNSDLEYAVACNYIIGPFNIAVVIISSDDLFTGMAMLTFGKFSQTFLTIFH
jgi:hypothetical protein